MKGRYLGRAQVNPIVWAIWSRKTLRTEQDSRTCHSSASRSSWDVLMFKVWRISFPVAHRKHIQSRTCPLRESVLLCANTENLTLLEKFISTKSMQPKQRQNRSRPVYAFFCSHKTHNDDFCFGQAENTVWKQPPCLVAWLNIKGISFLMKSKSPRAFVAAPFIISDIITQQRTSTGDGVTVRSVLLSSIGSSI